MEVFSDNAVRYHFRRSGLTAICIASNSDNECVFAEHVHYFRITLKIFIIWRLLRLSNCEWKPIRCHLPAIFSVSHRLNFSPVLWGFRFFGCPGQIFCIQTDWFCLLHLSRTILILLLSLYVYNSFTFDCFTLLVVLPKNKIRSIINSFI